MTTFILHGGYTRERNDSNLGFYREIVKRLPHRATIVLSYFASTDEKKIPQTFADHCELLREAAPEKELTFVQASKHDLRWQLSRADALLLNGGDNDKLIEVLKRYPDFKELIEGKTVAGSSAGAHALSTFYYSNDDGKVGEGLGVMGVRVICHFESKQYKNAHHEPGTILALMNEYPKELDLITLRDYEWKEFVV